MILVFLVFPESCINFYYIYLFIENAYLQLIVFCEVIEAHQPLGPVSNLGYFCVQNKMFIRLFLSTVGCGDSGFMYLEEWFIES